VNLPARGRAAGKVILLGEHAVVYGRPALAASLPIGLEVEVETGVGPLRVVSDRAELTADPRPVVLARQAAEILGLASQELVLRVRSELPPGVGLGSSAALAVAVLRALAAVAGRQLARDEELALGRRLEAVFHGTPSGIDPAAALLGSGCFRFVRGDPPTITPLRVARPFPLIVVLGGRVRSTGTAVAGLRARWDADRPRYERLFDDVASTVEAAALAIERGDLAALGRAFDRNQELLAALGVSAPEVEEMAAAARRAGALGAKLTGGGAGGAVVAVAEDAGAVARALQVSGAHTMVVAVSC
jgi:mevalonate kinase